MIWFFLAGWIAGAVAVIMWIVWWVRTHAVMIDADEKKEEGEHGTT